MIQNNPLEVLTVILIAITFVLVPTVVFLIRKDQEQRINKDL